MEDELQGKGLETVSIFLEKLLPSSRRERMKARTEAGGGGMGL